jgi:SAM-dependent methyltransferase
MLRQNRKKSSSELKFPYANESFDFVFLTSVFTHICPNEIENYMSEISRVLRKNGRCLITCFLLNDESRNLMNLGKNEFNFKFNFDGFASTDEEAPERAIALPEDFILKLFERNNLDIVKPIHYGGWYKENSLGRQDVVIALKK